MGELEQRVGFPRAGHDIRDEELEKHRRRILTLRDKTADLKYQLEDLKNRLRWCNIRIKGFLLQADAGRLADDVLRLLRHLAPDLVDRTLS
ncbi:hypothetical protein NDU88_003456 [Pleurodeles waltl]|uniref:Uncharacterized protein n=1 Tax=Pleurodeles waltl TaxID=8319 RepID=A0AAV7T4P9_PLEWA|nr:hypothetical protein NDU88_003456 [Pleurodeles waltl]